MEMMEALRTSQSLGNIYAHVYMLLEGGITEKKSQIMALGSNTLGTSVK